jgi:hypothetical protein
VEILYEDSKNPISEQQYKDAAEIAKMTFGNKIIAASCPIS